MAKPQFDVYQEVTNQIIEALEQGIEPWRCPWQKGRVGLPLRVTSDPYKGINSLLLSLRSWSSGYTNPVWMTFKQAKDLGGMVRKGETSSMIVKYGTFDVKPKSEGQGGDDEPNRRGYLKAYRVFNVEQIDGLEDKFPAPEEPTAFQTRPIEELSHIAADMIDGMGVGYAETGTWAFYSPTQDRVTMPPINQFHDAERFYSTLFHELVHATLPADRCDRVKANEGASFGNTAYAKEELVAEIGSAFLGATLGFEPDHIEDSAAYIDSWLQALRSDTRWIIRQAAAAQRAADYLLSFTQSGTTQTEAEAA